jgi:hypothetical protein
MALKLRRGLEADRDSILPAEGELIYTTDQKQLFVGDGETAGGTLVSSAVVSVNGNNGVVILTTDDIDEGTTNKFFTNTQARNAISVTGSGGTYNPTTGVINLTGGGTSSDSFKTITVAGQSSVVADSATDTLTLVAGTNITITTNDTTDTVTINSTASSSVEDLNDLLDVDAASPGDGQALVWDSGSSRWIAGAVGVGTVDSGVVNQLAFYTDTNVVGGDENFTIDTTTNSLYVQGSIITPNVIATAESASEKIRISSFHNSVDNLDIQSFRSRGTSAVSTAVQNGDVLFKLSVLGNDGVGGTSAGLITATVSSAPTAPITGRVATLSTGTAVVTFTTGNTTGLVAGQTLYKTAGIGEFGTTFLEDSKIATIDSLTQVTMSTNHAVAGSITFNSLGILPSQLSFSNVGANGKLQTRLRLRDNDIVSVGPDFGEFDGENNSGLFQIISMKSSDSSYLAASMRVAGLFDGATGQEIAFTRARGTITLGGAGYAPAQLNLADEVGTLSFYAWHSLIVDHVISSKITAESDGASTATGAPGKIKLSTVDQSGALAEGLSVDSYQMTTFGGMAKVATYADEAAAEAAVDNTPTAGMMYYDSGAAVAKMYGASAWHALW